MTDHATPAPGGSGHARVSRSTRVDITTVVACVVPLLALVLALLVDADADPRRSAPPAETPLTRASVICPSGGSDVVVASTSGESGPVSVTGGSGDEEADVAPGTTSPVDVGRGAAVVTGSDALAPGLVAGRFADPLASYDCRPPAFDQWFTGVGAGARHRSVLQLVNPDGGRAVVDVEVLGQDGPVDAPALRGIAVRGGEERQIDLAEVLPRRDELALHVTVVRGRISASVDDTVRGIGSGRTGDDALAAQDAPATENLLLGLPSGAGPRRLVLANPGTTQARATLRLVTGDSVFAPAGLDEIDLPPQSVVRVSLTDVLAEAGSGADRPVGLLVDSNVPTTASLSMFTRGDLLSAVPVAPLVDAGTTVLPAGKKRLELGAATRAGVVTVALWDADGTALPEQRVEVAPGGVEVVELPGEARLATVTPERTPVSAVVLVTDDDGATLVRVREPIVTGLVPTVRPGLP